MMLQFRLWRVFLLFQCPGKNRDKAWTAFFNRLGGTLALLFLASGVTMAGLALSSGQATARRL